MTNKEALELLLRNKSVFQYDTDMLIAIDLAIDALKYVLGETSFSCDEKWLATQEIPVGTTVHINPEDIKWEVKGDLISRSALKKSMKSYADDQYAENEYLGECAVMNIIDNAPVIEYTFEEAFQKTVCEQRLYCPQGEWIITREEQGAFGIIYKRRKCNRCGWENSLLIPRNFCPNCGVKMKGGAGNEKVSM